MTAKPRPARRRISACGIDLPPLGRICLCLFLLTLLGFFAASDASAARKRTKPPLKPKGITHMVVRGQTLFRISQAYQVRVAILMEANRLKASTPLRVGQRLFIPGVTVVKKVDPFRPLTKED